MILYFLLINHTFIIAQTNYDNCGQALEICPNVVFSVSNIDATKTLCSNCDDNFSFCITPNNTIWLKFTSNSIGGNAQIDFSNLIFENGANQDDEVQAAIILAGAPCDATTYSLMGSCQVGTNSNFSLAANLAPETEYYLVINGTKNGIGITKAAELSLDLLLSGVGVDRIIPFISISGEDSLCKDQLATFQANMINCPDSTNYKWFINGVFVAQTPTLIYQTSSLENNDVLSVSNTCFSQCPVTVSGIHPTIFVETFTVEAGEDKFILPGEDVILDGVSDADTFFWSPITTISNHLNLNPTVFPKLTTTYYLTGVKNNCALSDDVVITVDLVLHITNSFTPNEDGFNDTWEIPALIQYPNCLVQIYDRWGQLIFTSVGYNDKKSWNGKINGKLAESSVFYYAIDLRDGSDSVLKGSVSLIK